MLRVRTVITGFQGGPWIHVSYWVGADTGPGAIAANAAIGVYWNAVRAAMSTQATFLTDAIVAQMDPVTGNRTANYPVTPVTNPGLDAGDPLPPATQGLQRLRSGTFALGREIRGRINVPGLTEASSTNGRPTAGLLTTMNNAAVTLIGATAPALAVWSRRNGTAIDVTSTDAWTDFAIRRSRRNPG